MTAALKTASGGKYEGIPPRERILAVAADLFYRHGIRAIGVESIAEAAGTNKMTLYRHFTSKDELVAEYLRRLAEKASSSWDTLAAQHPANPRAQLRGWLEDMAAHVGSGDERGCALANAAVELPDKDHPARRVIEAFKTAQRQRIIDLCAAAEAGSARNAGGRIVPAARGRARDRAEHWTRRTGRPAHQDGRGDDCRTRLMSGCRDSSGCKSRLKLSQYLHQAKHVGRLEHALDAVAVETGEGSLVQQLGVHDAAPTSTRPSASRVMDNHYGINPSPASGRVCANLPPLCRAAG